MEIAGEAASQVSRPTRERYPQVPWSKLVGMRNRLIHAYHEMDLEILWETMVNDLAPLIVVLEEVIRKEQARG